MRIKRIISVLITLLFTFGLFAQEQTNGLLFASSAKKINDRTSLILFDEKPLKLKNTFSIRFDLSIWDIKQFGYILRLINENKQEINFAFVNFYGEDKMYLDFHSPITHNSIQIPVTSQNIEEKQWLPINIQFDLNNDVADITLRDSTYTCYHVGLKNPSVIKFAFGLYGLNLDVPEMVIRNIRITENDNTCHQFSLNETTGNKVYDEKGKCKGVAKNPEWIVNKHHYWENKTTIKTTDPQAGIAYDNKRNKIVIIDKNVLQAYSPQQNKTEQHVVSDTLFTFNSGEAIYDLNSDRTFIYNLLPVNTDVHSFAAINMSDYDVKYANPDFKKELFHHNVFRGGADNALYIFGGYGNHTYSNKIQVYDSARNVWTEVATTGDEIFPRYFAAAGKGISSSEVLIFGGIGNESGKQEHGGRYLYDLFMLNLDSKQVKKLWQLNDKDVTNGFVPCSNLIVNEENTHFFTLCYAHHNVNTTMQLYKFSLADGSYEIVSDSIPISSEHIETSAYLFYNEIIQEFYTVIREYINKNESEVRIYSLLYPPVNMAELKPASQKVIFWLIPGSILIICVLVVLKLFLSRKKDVNPVYNKDVENIHNINSIYIFGDFTVFDAKGKDISYRFSSKLKALFALILFYSVDKSGISTEMLTAELWPDKDTTSAKNTRGVTVNKLRNILADINGITLLHHDSKWFFSFESDFYCDFIEYKDYLKTAGDNETHIIQLLNVLKRGTLFPNLHETWIDSFKSEYENKTEKILHDYILNLYALKKYSKVIEYAELYFIIDPLNEEILNICMNSFKKIGKTEQAQLLFNKFMMNYKKSMGKNPDIISPV